MQMIHDAISPERIREFLKAEAEAPSAVDVAATRDAELRAKRDQADEARDRADFERKRAALSRFEAELSRVK